MGQVSADCLPAGIVRGIGRAGRAYGGILMICFINMSALSARRPVLASNLGGYGLFVHGVHSFE